jgi:hypothetical protein
MICSFSRRFLFIKTRKTAGTSVEIALSGFCAGGDDIITPISPEDELLRLREGAPLPKNFSRRRYREHAYRAAVRARYQPLMKAFVRWEWPRRRFWNHMPVSEVRDLIPAERLRGVTTFTIERHPYEKVVSLAHFSRNNRHNRGKDLPAVIDTVLDEKRYLNYPQYTIGDELAVDRVLRHDRLMDDLNQLMRDLGLPVIAELPTAKAGFRSTRTPAADVLSAAQKARIRADARFEFERFGYQG